MRTTLKITALLVVILLLLAGGFWYKYPWLTPWYRAQWPAEEYHQIAQYAKSPQDPDTMMQRFEELYPFWLGTPWDYNGITETPGSGEIACGYFVTTMIRDMHIPVQRVKMAQCASEEMIMTLIDADHIQRYSNAGMQDMLSDIRSRGRQLYILGLDNHTGFIYHDGQDIWFIHSSGRFPRCVIREPADRSVVISTSAYRVLGSISHGHRMADPD